MSERRKRLSAKNRMTAYIAAGVVHAGIIGALVFNFTSKRETVDAAYAEKVDVVKATTIDESEIKKQQDKLKQAERERQRKKEQERKRLERLKQEAKDEEKRLADLKKKQETEREKAAELERQRKEIALKKQQEEELRKKREEERKKKEADERRRKQELDRIAREEQALEAQRQMNEALAAEEAFIAEQRARERTTTIVMKHLAMVESRVNAVRTVDPSFETWRKSVVDIKLSPFGDVQSVRTIESSGSARYDASVEAAIFKASPLPIPDARTEPDANRRFLDFELEFLHPNARQ